MKALRKLWHKLGDFFKWRRKPELEKRYFYADKKEKDKEKVYLGGGSK